VLFAALARLAASCLSEVGITDGPFDSEIARVMAGKSGAFRQVMGGKGNILLK
jgi:hypothetical protein